MTKEEALEAAAVELFKKDFYDGRYTEDELVDRIALRAEELLRES